MRCWNTVNWYKRHLYYKSELSLNSKSISCYLLFKFIWVDLTAEIPPEIISPLKLSLPSPMADIDLVLNTRLRLILKNTPQKTLSHATFISLYSLSLTCHTYLTLLWGLRLQAERWDVLRVVAPLCTITPHKSTPLSLYASVSIAVCLSGHLSHATSLSHNLSLSLAPQNSTEAISKRSPKYWQTYCTKTEDFICDLQVCCCLFGFDQL